MKQGKHKNWPREVAIQATADTARRYLPANYNEEDEGSEALLWEIGDSMETIEIESWADLRIPPGFELADPADQEEYLAYLEAERRTA